MKVTDPRVLLVEDNPGDARLIQEMLAEQGARPFVRVAERLDDALEAVADGGIDVVVLDLSLPDSQGVGTVKRLRQRAPDVPVVVLTGLYDPALAAETVDAGAHDYLVKGHLDWASLALSLRHAIQRQRLEEERKAVERQKDEFILNVSHDLRTPLAAIKASIGVVLANEPIGTPAALHRLLVNADLAADELGRLVEDLLELTRLHSGRLELYRTDTDLSEVVLRAVKGVEVLMRERGQSVRVVLPPTHLCATVDAKRIGRALLNLLGNAQKHGRDGGLVRVALGRDARNGDILIEVTDDGPGIAPEEQEHVFQRFFRLGEAMGPRPGSGLGLPIARGIAELHGGRLTLESTPGVGSTFSIHLPASLECCRDGCDVAITEPPDQDVLPVPDRELRTMEIELQPPGDSRAPLGENSDWATELAYREYP